MVLNFYFCVTFDPSADVMILYPFAAFLSIMAEQQEAVSAVINTRSCSDWVDVSTTNLPPPAFDSSLRPKGEHRVGFDCEFVERPKELQTECPICLHVLREPFQATCCGYIYCRSCIERVRLASKPCPTCNSTDFNIFPDKRLHKSLYSFKVWCSKRNKGCNWSGELRDLPAHLNDDPTALARQSHALRRIGCDFVQVKCTMCDALVQRGSVTSHEAKTCPFRPYMCEFCGEFESTYTEVTETHQPQCPCFPAPCPNECGETVLRRDMDDHLQNTCKLRPPDKVPCEFSFAGCSEMVSPEKMQDHLEENLRDHLSLVATSHLSLRERLMELQGHFDENNRYIEKLQKERKEMQEQFLKEVQDMRRLRSEFEKLRVRQDEERLSIELLQNYSSILPIIFTLDEYESRKSRNDMGWHSPPFYTHRDGYRMCLWVDIGGNGPGKGIYISVFLCLTRGEFDAKLKWPFRGSIIVQLLNQQDEEMHHTEVIKYHEHTQASIAGRVGEEGRKSKPWGKGKFMKHDELRSGGFVKNDSLRFRVCRLSM